jgi:hypothetical protein
MTDHMLLSTIDRARLAADRVAVSADLSDDRSGHG